MRKIGIDTLFRVANYGTKLRVILRKAFSEKRNIARVNRIMQKKNINKIVDKKKQVERTESINAFDSNLPLGVKISSWAGLKKHCYSSISWDCHRKNKGKLYLQRYLYESDSALDSNYICCGKINGFL